MTKTFPDVGTRNDGKSFSKEMQVIYDSFNLANETSGIENKKILKLSGGDPLRYKPFGLCKKYLLKALKSEDMHKYPAAAGDENYRNEISKYLLKEGFNSGKNIDLDNVIVTMSTTHGFKTILDIIARPYDVVLMPSPCYGLFTFFPERIDVSVKFIPLEKEDRYYINADKLEKCIQQINRRLEIEYTGKLEYITRVVAFLNQNPNNHTGIVMGKNETSLINNVSRVCKENNVYVIDDLVYRDLTFDINDIAVPMAFNEEYFDNTISLMGLSKCYGYASARAGIVLANKKIISLMRDKIFQQMDSIPVLQCAMLAGAFNPTIKRYKEHKRYFSKLNKEYEYRYLLLKCIVDGYSSLNNIKAFNMSEKYLKKRIKNDIYTYASSYKMAESLLNGIENVELLKGVEIKGGFFALLDYSKVKGKKDIEGNIIANDRNIYEYLVNESGIKIIMGSSIGFDIEDMIGRVTFALEIKEIVEYFEKMKTAIEKLK